jgi:tetratricopeptide (TPR) repeat protein
LPFLLTAPIVITLMLATRHRNRDYATTLSMWQDIADKTPGNVVALTNLGMMKYMAGDHPKAEVDFRNALALNPKSGAAYAGLGMLLEAQGKFPEAAEQFRRAIEYEPLSAEAYLNLAMVLANQHKYDEAVDALTPAVEKIPWEQDAAIVQGAMMLRAGKMAQGRDRLDRAIAADFDHAHAAQRAGQILIQLNLPESAIDYFQLAAQLSSKDPQTYLTLAMLLTQQGKMSQAMEQYRKVLQFLPDNQAALNNLAWFCATSPIASDRDGRQAVQYALRAVELTQHQNAGALDTLAAAYAESGQFDQAQKTAEQAVSLAQKVPDNPAMADMKQRLELYRANKPFRDQTIHPATQAF